jgi:ABC-2 type transport system permease protein
MNIKYQIARKEATEMFRDGRFWWSTGLVLVLLAGSLLAGWHHESDLARQRAEAEATARHHWLEQGEKNPHSAAHYGMHVFKPQTPLAAVDRGINDFVGVSVFLEAHRQNFAEFVPAADATPLRRLGELTASATMQLLIPLLIVLLLFGAFALERENGTLRQVMSLGVRRSDLFAGKVAGALVPLLFVLVPATLIGATTMVISGGATTATEIAPRALTMAGAYLLYFLVFVVLTLAVSANAPSSRAALIIMVGFWFFNGFIAPRIASDIGSSVHPAPSATEFREAVRADMEALPPWRERLDRIEADLIARFNLASIQDSPLHPSGVALAQSEAEETVIYNRHFDDLSERYRRQNRVREWAGVVSPLAALQPVSMALAGTDFSHHNRFIRAADAYRFDFVQVLNEDMAQNQAVGQTYAAGPELWSRIDPFDYHLPSLGWALGQALLPLTLLFAWGAFLGGGLVLTTRSLKID